MSFITWKILREFITNYTELATLQFGSGLRCNVFLGEKIPPITWNYAFIISLEKIPVFADVGVLLKSGAGALKPDDRMHQ